MIRTVLAIEQTLAYYKFRHIAVAHSQTDECQNSRPLSSSSLKTHVKSAIVILPSLLLSFRIPILHFWLAPSHSSCATLDLFLPCLQKEDDIHDWRRVSSSCGSSKTSRNGIPYATNNHLASIEDFYKTKQSLSLPFHMI